MVVMNDRAQAGSAFKNGRIELILNRRTLSDDSQGLVEEVNDLDEFGRGVNTSAKFYLRLTDSRRDAIQAIKYHNLKRVMRPQTFMTTQFKQNILQFSYESYLNQVDTRSHLLVHARHMGIKNIIVEPNDNSGKYSLRLHLKEATHLSLE